MKKDTIFCYCLASEALFRRRIHPWANLRPQWAQSWPKSRRRKFFGVQSNAPCMALPRTRTDYAVRRASHYGSSYCLRWWGSQNCPSASAFSGGSGLRWIYSSYELRNLFAQLGHALSEYIRPVKQFNGLGDGIFEYVFTEDEGHRSQRRAVLR